MYRAQYSFVNTEPGNSALDFKENDLFTVLDTKNPHWWLVQDGSGRVGYVPGNYLVKEQSHGLKDVLQSIDRAIDAISRYSGTDGLTSQQKSNIQKLQNHRRSVLEEHRRSVADQEDSGPVTPRRTAPTLPRTDSQPTAVIVRQESRSSKKSQAPPPPVRDSLPASHSLRDSLPANQSLPVESSVRQANKYTANVNTLGPSSAITVQDVPKKTRSSPFHSPAQKHKKPSTTTISDRLCSDLINSVRSRTNLSYDLSGVAVATVLTHLRDELPGLRDTMDTILSNFESHEDFAGVSYEENEDTEKLRQHFRELAACKDDSQQRSWFLHEDEGTIIQNLKGLLDILDNANRELCRRIVAEDHYEGVHNLVLYYQMESRVSIRLLLLQVFGALCHLEVKVVSELLYSVLPLELARDMQSDIQDIQKFIYSGLVLVMMFSMGEAPPFRHYDHLNEQFVEFLLDQIESPPGEDVEDQIPDLGTQILLAFNLHFELPSENSVMRSLATRSTANNFMEKIMLLVNREDDPVRILPHEPAPPNSLLKFMADLYSSSDTANLLYTNDAKVFIDIVLRQVSDLSPGDKVRTEYLSVFHLILTHSSYVEHQHRHRELQECFVRIAQEEVEDGTDTSMDKHIVQQIWKEFPQCFDPS